MRTRGLLAPAKTVIGGDVTVRPIDEGVRAACGRDRAEDAEKVTGHIFTGGRESCEERSRDRQARTRGSCRASKIDGARGHVTCRELKRKDPWLPPRMDAAGPTERGVGTVVGHGMKRRGTGRAKEGAANATRARLETAAPGTS